MTIRSELYLGLEMAKEREAFERGLKAGRELSKQAQEVVDGNPCAKFRVYGERQPQEVDIDVEVTVTGGERLSDVDEGQLAYVALLRAVVAQALKVGRSECDFYDDCEEAWLVQEEEDSDV